MRIVEARPKVLLEYSLRRETKLLSDEPSRSSEMASPKRESAKPPNPLFVVLPKRDLVA